MNPPARFPADSTMICFFNTHKSPRSICASLLSFDVISLSAGWLSSRQLKPSHSNWYLISPAQVLCR
ncbi:hypothetical protein M378DRAFT_456232 [Amanita muscaria Koide BX008]|uniref:Uncharacterized protein n=1 Tax=Amanita muscaria (strain Koide BX008) TaxID=946122 RepID=A0A0C2SQV7_AMAMK|nr:hypothetical protein M378DRAFT_456232 [Amanita muscaria Koide BX008]